MIKAIINVNLEIELPENIENESQADDFMFNYELPIEYVEDSFEFVKFIDDKTDDIFFFKS